jgi:pimeloyl-ACP methyl ester carboxylesterase
MSPRLLVITDLWGTEQADWLNAYTRPLSEYFEVTIYNSRVLGSVDEKLKIESEIHGAFVQGGLEKAVDNLIHQETIHRKSQSIDDHEVLAFSIGGAIAWKAALAGLKMNRFYAISSTRLRKEIKKPEATMSLIYGEEDPYRPNSEWQAKLGCEFSLIKEKGHTCYREKDVAALVVGQIMGQRQKPLR